METLNLFLSSITVSHLIYVNTFLRIVFGVVIFLRGTVYCNLFDIKYIRTKLVVQCL